MWVCVYLILSLLIKRKMNRSNKLITQKVKENNNKNNCLISDFPQMFLTSSDFAIFIDISIPQKPDCKWLYLACSVMCCICGKHSCLDLIQLLLSIYTRKVLPLLHIVLSLNSHSSITELVFLAVLNKICSRSLEHVSH